MSDWQNIKITLSNGKSGWFGGPAIITKEELESGTVELVEIVIDKPKPLDPSVEIVPLSEFS